MATYEQVTYNSDDGAQIGKSATEKVGFYGATPVAQRAAAIQANSVVSVSSNITIAASLTAWIVEVTATLNALGLWKGSA
ncbi:MAG: hypothetical protein RLZZ200_253 [Pseudomonadota bacterium]